MTFVKINPVNNLENIHNNLQRYLNDFSTNNFDNSCDSLSPKVNVRETENNIFIDAEVPGIKKENIKLSIKNSVLTLEGEKKKYEVSEGEKVFRNEINYGTFSRSFKLPKNVDTNKIKAVQDNGVLTITLEKYVPEEDKVKEIEIN